MARHLPAAVKHLLTLRNPNVLPSPPRSSLHAVLSSTLTEAKQHSVERGWLVLSTCTLLAKNRPSSVADLYRFATRTDANAVDTRVSQADALDKAAAMRESALKSTIFVGVPRVILALTALSESLEPDVREALSKDSPRQATPENIEATVARGQALWNSIYEPHADKLFAKLASYHPDFMTFIIQAYGTVLAPQVYPSDANVPAQTPWQGNLSRALGSVVGIACLRAEERVVPQLTSHVFGLLKARNEARSLSEGDQWLTSDEGTEWVIKAVDRIIDVVDESTVKAHL